MNISGRQKLAGGLMLLGLAMAAVLAVLSSRDKEPATATNVLFVVLAGVFQFAGAKVLQGEGQADPSLANASLRRLFRLQQRAERAEVVAQNVYEVGDAKQLKATMGTLSVEFSWLNEGLIEAIEDWDRFHPSVVAKLREEAQGGGSNSGESGGDPDGP